MRFRGLGMEVADGLLFRSGSPAALLQKSDIIYRRILTGSSASRASELTRSLQLKFAFGPR
jgi:hypothetical protein